MIKLAMGIAALAVSFTVITPRHIDLVRSNPTADTVLASAPDELLMTFSADVDFERSAVTMRNPSGGPVRLGDKTKTDDPHQIKVSILDTMSVGSYTVAWTAAPMDDHGSRGTFQFEVRPTEARE